MKYEVNKKMCKSHRGWEMTDKNTFLCFLESLKVADRRENPKKTYFYYFKPEYNKNRIHRNETEMRKKV